jgi:hypothetical protein
MAPVTQEVSMRALSFALIAVILLVACGAPAAPAPTQQSTAAPTDIAPPTAVPTTAPTEPPTQEPTDTPQPPTATPEPASPTPAPPTATPGSLSGQIGSTVTIEQWDITLYDMQYVDSFVDFAGREVQPFPGYKYLLLTFGFKRLGTGDDIFKTQGIGVSLLDRDNDRHECDANMGSITGNAILFPPGYEVQTIVGCRVPVTIVDAPSSLTAMVRVAVQGTRIGDVVVPFTLDGGSPRTEDVPLSLDPAHVIQVGQPITIDFGNTTDKLEVVIENPRWTGQIEIAGMERLMVDLRITNLGKQATRFNFRYALPLDPVERTIIHLAAINYDGGFSSPAPGQTAVVPMIIGAMKPHDNPLLLFLLADHSFTFDGKNYLVVELQPTR